MYGSTPDVTNTDSQGFQALPNVAGLDTPLPAMDTSNNSQFMAASQPPSQPFSRNDFPLHFHPVLENVLEWPGAVLPDTPVEPYFGQLQEVGNYAGGPPAEGGGGGGGLEHAESVASWVQPADTVFQFPPLDHSFPTTPLLFLPQASSLVPLGFDDLASLETPPATPTDPDFLFGQKMPPPAEQFTSLAPPLSGTFPSTLAAQSAPRQRLQGISNMEEEEDDDDDDLLQDLDVLDDISVFSDAEMSACGDEDTLLLPRERGPQGETGCGEACLEASGSIPAGDTLDPRLREAWEQSQGSQSLSPLVKEELRLKIMKKRHDNGQEELKVEFTPTPVFQMTEEDEARRTVRRAQNRGAAQRFRVRKKQKEQEMKKKLEENVTTNERLRQELRLLRAEMARLQSLLLQHRPCCHDPRLQSLLLPDTTTTTTTPPPPAFQADD